MENKTVKRGKTFKLAAAIAVAAVVAAGGFYYWSTREDEIQYKTVPVRRSDIRSTIQATGTLNPVETVDVGTQISGTIKELYFDYNSRVKEGQLIALMDSATQAAEVSQAEATVASAQADVLNAQAALDVAAKDLSRTRELAKRDLIAKADVDTDTSTWLKAKANLAAAEAKVAQHRSRKKSSNIILNFSSADNADNTDLKDLSLEEICVIRVICGWEMIL